NSNEITFSSDAIDFTIGVTVTYNTTGCSWLISENHTQQDLPSLDFNVLTDVDDSQIVSEVFSSADNFCWQDGTQDVKMFADAGEIGVAANTDEGDLSYTVDSYLESDLSNPFDTYSASGSNPTIDFSAWHTTGASGEKTGGTEIGGEYTVHVITMTYIDETDNQYQGSNTNCESSNSTAIIINPRPDLEIAYEADGDGLTDDDPDGLEFCYDDASINLLGVFAADLSNLGSGNASEFLGHGVSGTSSNQTTFDPSDAHDASHITSAGGAEFLAQSENIITFNFEDLDGCSNSITKTLYVNPNPEVESGSQIVYDVMCLGSDIEAHVVILKPGTTTEVTSYVGYTFDWVSSETSSTVLDDPSVVLPAADNLSVGMTLTITSPDGCITTITDTDAQGFPPIPTFTYVGITAGSEAGLDIEFQENSALLPDADVNSLQFTLTDDNGIEVVSLDRSTLNTSAGDFLNALNLKTDLGVDLAAGEYTAEVSMGTALGCNIPDYERTITILPVEVLGDPITGGGYAENFEVDMGGWFFEYVSEDGKEDTRESSWRRMELKKTGVTNDDILSDGRGNILVTQGDPTETFEESGDSIPTPYYESEVSYVYSPALDFSLYLNPMLRFDYIRDFESSRDGVVVQVSDDDGRNWQTLGDNNINSGINWYTNQGISAGPGDNQGRYPETSTNSQLVGFADVPFDEDGNRVPEWLESKHQITRGDYQSNMIRFRFVLSALSGKKYTDSEEVIGEIFDGFAFDNVRVYEINKLLVVEQFSSTLSADSKKIEEFIESGQVEGKSTVHHVIDWDKGTQGVWINYYTDVFNDDISEDPINARNKVDPGTRATFYGVTDVPTSRISGSTVDFDLTINPEDFGNKYNALALGDTDFNINKDHPTLPNDIVLNASDPDVISVTVTFRSLTDETDDIEVGFFLAVVEKTKTNVTSGEYVATDTIRNALRVLLPGPAGEYYKGPLAIGDSFTYTFDWTITEIDDPDELRVIAYAQYYSHSNANKVGSIEQAAWLDLDGEGKQVLITGFENKVSRGELEVYPNPADNRINLALPDTPDKDVYWSVYDQSGRQAMKGLIKRGTKTPDPIDTSDLPSGLYIIQLHDEERLWTPMKVLIAH
ncbi:MAG: T9SS type A sorting domain-containing protein, partial [Cytophagales bacterium]|nr:T9SS type A sorting domain-containing protein [Cytophagales bacterium]